MGMDGIQGQRSTSLAQNNGPDYQKIYDNAYENGSQPTGFKDHGYVKVEKGDDTYLTPFNLMGGPTYRIEENGSVYSKATLPGAEFEKKAGAGTVELDSIDGDTQELGFLEKRSQLQNASLDEHGGIRGTAYNVSPAGFHEFLTGEPA
ncbi:MAG: hypothetical protein KTR14_05835, partial [Vampirovibrio sp.]|nr:hypothetical protein [Vampirovibrio sp.]